VPGTSAWQHNPSLSAFTFLPPHIWNTSWVAAVPPGNPKFMMEYLMNKVMVAATKGQHGHTLTICGPDIVSMAESLKMKLAAAVTAGDSMDILSPD
jgi:hypothetical protein